MKTYIGRIVRAERTIGHDNSPGHTIVYPDGYVTWLPEEVFEIAFSEVTDIEKETIRFDRS